MSPSKCHTHCSAAARSSQSSSKDNTSQGYLYSARPPLFRRVPSPQHRSHAPFMKSVVAGRMPDCSINGLMVRKRYISELFTQQLHAFRRGPAHNSRQLNVTWRGQRVVSVQSLVRQKYKQSRPLLSWQNCNNMGAVFQVSVPCAQQPRSFRETKLNDPGKPVLNSCSIARPDNKIPRLRQLCHSAASSLAAMWASHKTA